MSRLGVLSRSLKPFAPVVLVLAPICLALPARADNIAVTLSAPKIEFPNFSGICDSASPGHTCVYGTETFEGWTGGGFTTSFQQAPGGAPTSQYYSFPAGTSISGTYSGAISYDTDNTYGGAYGTQPYPSANGSAQYTLALSSTGIPGVNYFGVWITAMDASNLLTLTMADGSVYAFDSKTLTDYIANDAADGAQYYGDPDNGLDSSEPFAYVNFYDTDGFISSIDFSNDGSSNFESSNDAAGYFNPLIVEGRFVTSVPEPAGIAVLAMGLLGLLAVRRRRSGFTGR